MDNTLASPVVLDNGSGVLKAGYAGSDLPDIVFQNYVGRPKHERIMAGAVDEDIFIGRKAEELRGILRLSHPMTHGVVTDWDDMESVWSHLYTKELSIPAEDHPLLLTETPINPRKNRERAAEILFERFNIPALFISNQAVLALYASGRTTGLVLDCGDGASYAAPIYEGFSMAHATTRVDVGGRDVTEYLALLLRRSGYNFDTSAGLDTVRRIKETLCEVAQAGGRTDSRMQGARSYTLPDGRTLEASGSERTQAPEALFDPSLIGIEGFGVHELLHHALRKCDLDVRKTLYAQVVLCGGSTLLPGFGDRLLAETRRLAGSGCKIRMTAAGERQYAAWMGGSILASLASFRTMWVSNRDYLEHGPAVLHRTLL